MSDKVYTSEANIPLNPIVRTMKDLEDMVKVEKTRSVGNMLVINSSTQPCRIRIGGLVKVVFPDSMKLTQVSVGSLESVK